LLIKKCACGHWANKIFVLARKFVVGKWNFLENPKQQNE
jgi:hypothetical protein